MLAAIGICPWAAMRKCPVTASLVTDCDCRRVLMALGRRCGRCSADWLRRFGALVLVAAARRGLALLGHQERVALAGDALALMGRWP